MTTQHSRTRWAAQQLLTVASHWRDKTRQRLGAAQERSPWWPFIVDWPTQIMHWLTQFQSGLHVFSPMRQYRFSDGARQVWSYLDRLVIHWLYHLLKPTFQYLISPLCVHLAGPSSIKHVTGQLKAALESKQYQYVFRLDIRSYYASINRDVLLEQLNAHYDDPRLRHYFEAIVNTAIDVDGEVSVPKKGIPRSSSLSPFFGALYLSALDNAFSNRAGVFYRRYMDDILLLVKNRRHYARAKKRIFSILRSLRLQLSKHKTKMGRLKTGFHFLGVNFEVSQNPQGKTQAVAVTLHSRTIRRAQDKIQAMRDNAVHPAQIHRYLIRWAAWWQSVLALGEC